MLMLKSATDNDNIRLCLKGGRSILTGRARRPDLRDSGRARRPDLRDGRNISGKLDIPHAERIVFNRTLSCLLLTLLILLIGAAASKAQGFGQNNVQYTYFKWEYLTTEHFDIYYNQDGRKIADFVAETAEQAFANLAQRLDYHPEDFTPLKVITYQSHNDFEQTSLAGASPDEATGGFTEFLKNRVVVPFEGDYAKFRHVIHHELTHAVMLNLMFGEGLGAIISGMSQTRVPTWFMEGMAEYESQRGLDPETEAIIRDAVINDVLPEVHQLDIMGYLGQYKYGQSVVYWIAWRYGDEKLGEIVHNLRGLKDFDRALRASIGIGEKELSKRWRHFIKERFWPQVVSLDLPANVAVRLTDHEKERCYVNNSPMLSPNGELIAFISDRSDYFDVYLMNSLDGKIIRKLVRGQRSGQFEELHWLRPGIAWSPAGDRIAFCAKSGARDALFLIDVNTGSVNRCLTFDMDGLFSPAWSPDGKRIALVRVLNGRSDLALVNLATGELHPLSNDLFDEADPCWSPDGGKLLFSSNRDNEPLTYADPPLTTPFGRSYEDFDLYELDLHSLELRRLTNDPFDERTPLWIENMKSFMYVSNRSGAYNLYLQSLEDTTRRCLTNLVSGCSQPSISSKTGALVFSSFSNSGYDVFLMNDPFKPGFEVQPKYLPPPEDIPVCGGERPLKTQPGDYSRYVFDRLHAQEAQAAAADSTQGPDSTAIAQRSRDEEGRYKAKKYSVSLTPDYIFLNAGYSPYYQLQGSGLLMLSDVIGNHRMYVSLDLNQTIDWSNFFLAYQYTARRTDLTSAVAHYAYLFYGDNIYWQDQTLSGSLYLAYPLSRFNRTELGLTMLEVSRKVYDYNSKYYHYEPPSSRKTTFIPSWGFIHDTSIWHSGVEPANGERWRVDALWSPNLGSADAARNMQFHTLSGDYRRYVNIKKDYTFGVRLSGAASQGRNQQRFYLGGMMNWFNYRIDDPSGGVRIESIEDVHFSSFVTPLRGVGYYNQVGTRYLLGNLEFRFPFIKHLAFGWPLPAYFYNIRGALFLDMGSAWDRDDVQKALVSKHWTTGYGFGVRLDLGIFPVEWDVAWSPDPSSGLKPCYYFSISQGF